MVEQQEPTAYVNPYKFNAKELDSETGLYYYGARYYNPRLSIWYGVDPLAVYNPVMETQFYGDGQHNGGSYFWGNNNPYIYTYQNPIKYIDPNGKQTEGYQSDEAKKLSEIVTIRGQKYHKNTVNNWASFKNWVNSKLGGDDDFWVEKKPYDPTDDRFIHELVDNSAGSLVGGAVWKFGGKLLSRTIFKETGQVLLKFCFAKGTLINTESGNIPIEQIKVGDKVWSYNKETNTNELKDVTAVFKRRSEEMLNIKVQNIDIICTPEHPFYVNGIWVEAKDLKVNSELKLFDGNISKVSSIQKSSKATEVYNLEVLDNHNYYISQNKILVHNNCEWKSVLHPRTLEKTIEKTWGKNAVDSFDNIIEQLASGKAGKNIHNLSGDLKGYKAIDIAGTGSGRGAGRIIFKETEKQVEIIGVVKDHNYGKIIK